MLYGIINARTTMGINIGGFPCNSCHPVPSNNSLLESKKQCNNNNGDKVSNKASP